MMWRIILVAVLLTGCKFGELEVDGDVDVKSQDLETLSEHLTIALERIWKLETRVIELETKHDEDI